MKWKTYWLYAGNTIIQSVLLPVGCTEAQIKDKALHDLEVMPALAYPSSPAEWRNRIIYATVIEDPHEFERKTPKEHWGYLPPNCPGFEPESPWDTKRREIEAARSRLTTKFARMGIQRTFTPIDELFRRNF